MYFPLTCAGARHSGATPSKLTAYFREKEREREKSLELRVLKIFKDFANYIFPVMLQCARSGIEKTMLQIQL